MVTQSRTFIYGSCVTRDSVEYWEDYGLELVGYNARQSLISAYSEVNAERFDISGVRPGFTRRMVRGDVEGSLPARVRETATSWDHIIWDITDERNGVLQVPGGGYVTRLQAYRSACTGPEELGPRILFGEDAHFKLWCDAADRFLATLEAVGKRTALVVNAVPWADHYENGDPTSQLDRPSSKRFNSKAERYYEYLARSGVSIARPDSSKVIASTTHQWGPEPYHFTESTYRACLDSITPKLT